MLSSAILVATHPGATVLTRPCEMHESGMRDDENCGTGRTTDLGRNFDNLVFQGEHQSVSQGGFRGGVVCQDLLSLCKASDTGDILHSPACPASPYSPAVEPIRTTLACSIADESAGAFRSPRRYARMHKKLPVKLTSIV